jgi:hypothetical protein
MTESPFDDFSAEDDHPDIPEGSYEDLYNQNKELLDAIHLLEKAIPEVDDSLGIYISLFDIYSEIESMTDAGHCLVEAAKQVHPGHHDDLAYFLYNQLELFAQLHPDAQSAYERMGQLISQDNGELDANTLYLDQRKLYQVDLIPEILLANHLHRSRVISDQEYHLCLQDLCWFTSKAPQAPRSCIYVLEDRGLPHCQKAIEFLCHDAATPYIDLALIDIKPDFFDILPPDYCFRRAACVFGEVGGEPLVAVLNPHNLQLLNDVSRITESEPHAYLASARGYQTFLDQQKTALA